MPEHDAIRLEEEEEDEEEEEEGLYKLLPANKADHLCQRMARTTVSTRALDPYTAMLPGRQVSGAHLSRFALLQVHAMLHVMTPVDATSSCKVLLSLLLDGTQTSSNESLFRHVCMTSQ